MQKDRKENSMSHKNFQFSILSYQLKNILFDFDGVILDSMKIKGDGFVELFKDYGEEFVSMIEKYHYKNGGVSRFEKIRYFYNNILNQEISNEKVLELADKFSEIILEKLYSYENLIEDTVAFIMKNYEKYDFHIVSGAEHNELNKLCDFFELTKYFKSINGSPTPKEVLIENIIDKYNYNKAETILIGDSVNDYYAAKINHIKFYGYNNEELKKYGNFIETFKEVSL